MGGCWATNDNSSLQNLEPAALFVSNITPQLSFFPASNYTTVALFEGMSQTSC